MTTLHDDYETLANQRLIAQMARYYNSARLDIEIYREMNATVLQRDECHSTFLVPPFPRWNAYLKPKGSGTKS
jgi:hypothetical protein